MSSLLCCILTNDPKIVQTFIEIVSMRITWRGMLISILVRLDNVIHFKHVLNGHDS